VYHTKLASSILGHSKGFKKAGRWYAGNSSAMVTDTVTRAAVVGNNDLSSSDMQGLVLYGRDYAVFSIHILYFAAMAPGEAVYMLNALSTPG
jgi:hypothetical protein